MSNSTAGLSAPDNQLPGLSHMRSVAYTQPVMDNVLPSAYHGQISITRPVLTSSEIQLDSGTAFVKLPLTHRIREQCVYSCQPKVVLRRSSRFIRCFFPFLDSLINYRWKTDLLSDLSAGLTVGVMNVPQGMAYSMLAGLPPVYGLYVSFVAPLLYAVFGRCAQLSLGTFAVISLLLSEPIRRLCDQITNSDTKNMTFDGLVPVCFTPETDGLVDLRPLIAFTLTFLVGIIQIMIGLLRLGTLTCYLAPAMVDGFVTGAAVHVFTSQISSLFGVKEAKKKGGIGSLFLVYVTLFRYVVNINTVTLAISALSVSFLLIIKTWIEPFIQRIGHCKFPLPSELILVAIGTTVSHSVGLNENFNVSIVGRIESGMPDLTLPVWSLIPEMIQDAVVIGVTGTFLTISLVKLFATRHKLDVNYNHELTGLGFISLACSFFASFVPAGSVSRSAVCEGAGARTPLNGIASSIFVLFVLLYLGPYFSVTPTCILSAIIAVALKNILMRISILPKLWRVYKRDFFLFFVTFMVTLIFDVTYGLVAGVCVCFLALTEKQRHLNLVRLVQVSGTEIFSPVASKWKIAEDEKVNWDKSLTLPRIMTFRLTGALNFASGEQLMVSMKTLLLQEHYTCVRGSTHESGGDILCGSRMNAKEEDNTRELDAFMRSADTSIIGTLTPHVPCEREITDDQSERVSVLESNAVQSSRQDFLNPESDRLKPLDVVVDNLPDGSCGNILTEEKSLILGTTIIPVEDQTRPKAFLLIDISGLVDTDPTGLDFLRAAHNELFQEGISSVYCGDLRKVCDFESNEWSHHPSIALCYPTLLDAFVACSELLSRDNNNDNNKPDSLTSSTGSEETRM